MHAPLPPLLLLVCLAAAAVAAPLQELPRPPSDSPSESEKAHAEMNAWLQM